MYDQYGQGGADRQWQTLTLYLYELGWNQQNFGRAAAVAWLLFLIIVVIARDQLPHHPDDRRQRSDQSRSSVRPVTPDEALAMSATRRSAATDRRPGYLGLRRPHRRAPRLGLPALVVLPDRQPATRPRINQNGMLCVPGGNFFENAATVIDSIPFWKALLQQHHRVVGRRRCPSCSSRRSPATPSPSCGSAAATACSSSSSRRWPCRPSSASCRCSSSCRKLGWTGSLWAVIAARPGHRVRRVLDDAVPARTRCPTSSSRPRASTARR